MSAALTPEQVADVLDDAADYIEAHGWCRTSLLTPDGRVCAMGAIAMSQQAIDIHVQNADAVLWTWKRERAEVVAAAEALGSVVDSSDPYSPIPHWNDDPARTKQEVLDAFRAAAKEQRRRSP